MKKFLLFLSMLCCGLGYSQQQIILMTENFETPTNAFDLYSPGVGSQSGTNTWIINNNYNGAPIYPNTTPQDSIVSGTITNSPHSTYLHIFDTVAYQANSTIAGCEWDPANASDHFCQMNNGFCSLSMTDVTFTFYWIAGGDSSAYGELYYSSNNGPWHKTGRSKYYNQKLWQYEVVSDTAFNNKQNLRFGFRWVNPTGAPASPSMSFGIDEIIAVGTYDNVTNPTHIQITGVSPDTVCQNDYLLINYKLSKPLCDGQYQIEILNNTYHVVNGPNFPVFTISAPDTTGITFIQMPANQQGNCFHIVLRRVSPAPAIDGDTSICFSIVRCPASIFTFSAPVMNDTNTTCILSEIDVKFYSFGTFGPSGNIYYAQLSDSNGSFSNPTILGSLPSNQNYGGPPGNVSGLIPASVPPGCGYYIRVVSTNPSTIGSLIGPFCLKHCDELTNNITDLHFCVRYPKGTDTAMLHIKINEWNNHGHYDTCNNYSIQLLDMNTFAVLNTGGLGVFHFNHSDSFLLVVGPYASLPVPPGSYYMRILSNCFSDSGNYTGSVIRITIGAPNPVAPEIMSPDSVYCNTGFVNLFVNPFNNPPSKYQWLSNGLNNGLPFLWDFNPLTINFTSAPINTYTFLVREINYDCPGPWATSKKIAIISTPRVHISGPAVVCYGDTAVFYVDFLPRTYYTWTVPDHAHIVNQGNNQVYVVFDSLGTYTISDFSLNACGSDSGKFTLTVTNLLDAHINAAPHLCLGDSITVTANTSGLNHAFLTIDSGINGKPGAMFNLIAHDDLTIDSFAAKLLVSANFQSNVSVFQKRGSYIGNEQNSGAWTQLLATSPISTATNQMVTFPDPVSIHMAPGDTFGFYITTTDVPHTLMAYSPPGAPPLQGVIYKSDNVMDYVQGSINDLDINDAPFGPFIGPRVWNGIVYYHSKAGLHYMWNTGDTAPVINPRPTVADTKYVVRISDSTGCSAYDSVSVHLNPKPTVNAGPDGTICDGDAYTIHGTASVPNVMWNPATGLDNAHTISPTFQYGTTASLAVVATDTATGCSALDSLTIYVNPKPSLSVGPDTLDCGGLPYHIPGVSSVSHIIWTPGTGLDSPTIIAPTFHYSSDIDYVIIATDTATGCRDTAHLKITVLAHCNSYIHVADAFSPNHNGTNDHFTLFATNISDYTIRIYNRWGELVYESSDLTELNDLSKGWDGTYKGQPQNAGTFVYHLIATDYFSVKISKSGNITLLR